LTFSIRVVERLRARLRLIQVTLLVLILVLMLVLLLMLVLRVVLMGVGTLRRGSVKSIRVHRTMVLIAVRTLMTEDVVMCLRRCTTRWQRSRSSYLMLLKELRKVLMTIHGHIGRVLRLAGHGWRHAEARWWSGRITLTGVVMLMLHVRVLLLLLLGDVTIHHHVSQLVLEIGRSIAPVWIHHPGQIGDILI